MEKKQQQRNKYISLLMTFLLIILAVKSNFNDFHLYFNFDKNEMSANVYFQIKLYSNDMDCTKSQ